MGNAFYEARILILPLFFFCIALSQPYIATLIFALLTGLLWDAEHTIAPFTRTTDFEVETVDNLKYGYSILLFGLIGFLIKFLQANLKYRGLGVYVVIIFLSLFLYLSLETLLLLFIRGWGTLQDYRFLYQILFTSLFTALFSPLLIFTLVGLWKMLGTREKGLIQDTNTLIRRTY